MAIGAVRRFCGRSGVGRRLTLARLFRALIDPVMPIMCKTCNNGEFPVSVGKVRGCPNGEDTGTGAFSGAVDVGAWSDPVQRLTVFSYVDCARRRMTSRLSSDAGQKMCASAPSNDSYRTSACGRQQLDIRIATIRCRLQLALQVLCKDKACGPTVLPVDTGMHSPLQRSQAGAEISRDDISCF